MYKRAAVAAISFWSLVASAADWQVVADTKLGQLRLDKSSVTKEGKFTMAVLVYKFKDSQRLTAPPHAVFNKRQDDVLVDCSNPSLGILASRFFEGDKPVSTFSLKAVDVKFNPSTPGNMVETVVHVVCAAAPQLKGQGSK